MNKELKSRIEKLSVRLFNIKTRAEVFRSDEQFGDFSTNVGLKLAREIGRDPREIAQAIAEELNKSSEFREVTVAGPGFVNITLKDPVLFDSSMSAHKLEKTYLGQEIVTEYSDPNPFKVLHAGHFYTSVVGDSISNLLEAAGANVHRVNYGGDVGLHAAKTMWAMLQDLGGENPESLETIDNDKRADWLADCYVKGTAAYGDDEKAKSEINELNKKIYTLVNNKDKDSPLAKIYWTARGWSYDYFDAFYERAGIKFEKYYPESEVARLGLNTVKQNTPKIYSDSDGAIVYEGEKEGLHTRVFITREGLPTYEAKEVGLILTKNQDYKFDRSVVITANEISQYMQVVLNSIAKFAPDLVDKTTHLTHGMVKLPGARKMSSRKGNILKAVDILDLAEASSKKINPSTTPDVVLGAIKYSFLKSGLGGDIVFDANESVSIEGNSGPYLQYALVRARSILQKAGYSKTPPDVGELNPAERSLARKITIYPEVFVTALEELSLHHICTYLYELAQTFNRFYESNRVIGDQRSALRISLVKSYANVLESGLNILGISAPEKM
ncbi:MAG TPA: arginine--tRNA ligase [Candidatus Saccharimonadales bacterium]|nr:arginine--tRNA ligase [Candidatus Saccharimonadales bacterium]